MKFCQLIIHTFLVFLTITCVTDSISLSRRSWISSRPNSKKDRRPVEPKYFHEPSGGGNELDHYDIRYFNGVVTPEEKMKTLQYLIRSYLTFFYEHNFETWIAHGTLLGWWWNGMIMPWDWDLDTQVSDMTLTWIGENFNMSRHHYTFPEIGGELNTREYLLDVNHYIGDRVRGDGNNIIDARWIDTRNGLFIDITGVSETEPGVLSCKNNHHYRIHDLYPLRESTFEGVKTKIPYDFELILIQEYSKKALTNTLYEGLVILHSPSQIISFRVPNPVTMLFC